MSSEEKLIDSHYHSYMKNRQLEIWKDSIDFYKEEIEKISKIDPTSRKIEPLQKELDGYQALYDEGIQILKLREEKLKASKEGSIPGVMGFDEDDEILQEQKANLPTIGKLKTRYL